MGILIFAASNTLFEAMGLGIIGYRLKSLLKHCWLVISWTFKIQFHTNWSQNLNLSIMNMKQIISPNRHTFIASLNELHTRTYCAVIPKLCRLYSAIAQIVLLVSLIPFPEKWKGHYSAAVIQYCHSMSPWPQCGRVSVHHPLTHNGAVCFHLLMIVWILIFLPPFNRISLAIV